MERATLPETRLEPIPLGSRDAPILLVPDGVAVGLVWLVASGGIGALRCLLSIALPPDYDGAPPPPHWVEWLSTSGYGWVALVCAGILLAHRWRGPVVWAVTFGFLFAQCAALCTSCVSCACIMLAEARGSSAASSGLDRGAVVLWAIPALGALVTLVPYFRSATWYGVPPRRRWRTLWFSGGWMLLLTALLFGANQIAQHRYFQ